MSLIRLLGLYASYWYYKIRYHRHVRFNGFTVVYAFPGSSESRRRRLIKKYYTILVNISGRETCRSLARRFCLRPKYMKKSLDYLVGQGLIDFDGMYYQAKHIGDAEDDMTV